MVQKNKSIRPIDMRVIIMEMIKAVNLTVQYTQIGPTCRQPGEDNKKASIEAFMRTVFGILSHRTRPSKQGYTFAIDFRDVDERAKEGIKLKN